MRPSSALESLRAQVRQIEGRHRRAASVLPFGLTDMDSRLPAWSRPWRAGDDKSVLACFEEGLRHGGLGAVVAEVARLPMTASRRLQLAAEDSDTIGIALRRWHRQTEASDFGQPTAAVTRWRVSALPSAPLTVEGVGRPRRLIELIRCRAGESADFELEACDDTGRLALPSDLVHGPGQTEVRRRRASA
jgi:protein ImuA